MTKYLLAPALLIGATTLEAIGDALVRKGLFEHAGIARALVLLAGGGLLFGYGTLLNLAPLPFERIVGLYIATLFVVWQIVAFAGFRALPSAPVAIGGTLIVIGGLIVSFWQPEG